VLFTVSLSVGMMFGFSAILLPQLEDENIMAAKSEEASWIGKKPKFRGLITWSKISSLKTLIENYQWHHGHNGESKKFHLITSSKVEIYFRQSVITYGFLDDRFVEKF